MRVRKLQAVLLLAGAGLVGAVVVHAAARPRPPLPKITAPVMFDTPEADRILEALQVFPPDNPWNQDVSGMPVAKDSAAIVASIGAGKNLGYNLDMGFILVPPDQKRVPVKLVDYPDESDPGPYPVPDNAPIEDWPLALNEDVKALTRPGQTLEDIQRNGSGDRHILVVDPVNGKLYEFWQSRRTDAGWQASNEADVRPEDRRAAPRALDLLRRRRPADLPRRRPLRRVRARQGRARDALHRPPLAPRLRAAGDPLGEPALRQVLPAHGRALPAAPGLRHLVLPEARAGDPRGVEELRHVRGRQRQRLADVDLAGPPARGARDAEAREGLRLRGGRRPALAPSRTSRSSGERHESSA